MLKSRFFKSALAALTALLLVTSVLVPGGSGGNVRAAAAWWNASWTRVARVTIAEMSGATLTDYQIKVVVPYDTDMKADLGDIRFVTDNGTVLSYWCENVTARPATFWVKMPSLAASVNTTIGMYYGNTGATSLSDIHATFIWGDDFQNKAWTDANIYPWNATGQENQGVDVAVGEYNFQAAYNPDPNPPTPPYRVNVNEAIAEIVTSQGGGAGYPGNRVLKPFPTSYVVETRVKTLATVSSTNLTQSGGGYICAGYDTVSDKYESVLNFQWSSANLNKVVLDTWSSSDNATTWPHPAVPQYIGYQTVLNTWYTLKTSISKEGTDNRLKVLVGDGLFINTLDPSLNFTGLGFLGYDPERAYHVHFDDFRVRAYASVEPTVSLGAEQTPATVVTGTASAMANTTATLGGNLTSKGTAATVNVYFEYGTTTSYGSTSSPSQAMTGTGVFTAPVTGLTPGTIYHFRAKADGAASGIVSGSDATFNTTGTPPTVTTSTPATSITNNSATLAGALGPMGTASTATVYFEYGTVGSGAYASVTANQTLRPAGPFSAAISGLAPSTTYHFRARADAGLHGVSAPGNEVMFTTLTPPAVTSLAASSVSYESALVSGNVTSFGTGTQANVYFEYGLTTAYGNTTGPVTRNSLGVFATTITGLLPTTTYHFRAAANGGTNGIGTGGDLSFTTATGVAPVVSTSSATSVTNSSAVLNGDLTLKGTATTVNVSFDYGLTTAYGSTTPPQPRTATGVFNATISGLNPTTTYYFRARANGGVHGSDNASGLSFTTNTPPTVATGAATGVGLTSATLGGSLGSLGTAGTVNVYFQYGPTASYGASTTPQPMTATGAYTTPVTGLIPGTVYHFRAVADGGVHGTAVGIADGTFLTAGTRPTVTSSAAVGGTTSATLNGSLTLGDATSVNVYFEYGPTTAYGTTTPLQSKTVAGPFNAVISGLATGATYHFRAVGQGGIYGNDLTFTTSSGDSGGGGGFGGSGGGALPAAPGVTNLSIFTSSDGVFNLAAVIKSEDGKAWLTINKGTLARTSTSSPLLAIGIIKKADPGAPAADWKMIGSAYDFTPEAATFSPGITLTVSYDPAAIPSGLAESKLVLMTWDTVGGKWVAVEGSVVDTTARTISAPLVHFSTYAIMVRARPASFTVGGLSLSPGEVAPGSPVSVGLSVTNSGDLSGSYSLSLAVDGKGVDTRDFTVAGGASASASFSVSSTVPGAHTVSAGSQSGTFTVKKPPVPATFAVSGLSITPSSVDAGGTVTINAAVANTGDLPGTTRVTLRIGGETVSTKDVAVAAGAKEAVTFTATRDAAGSYTVNVNDLAGSFVVNAPPPKPAKVNSTLIVVVVIALVVVVAVAWMVAKRRKQAPAS